MDQITVSVSKTERVYVNPVGWQYFTRLEGEVEVFETELALRLSRVLTNTEKRGKVLEHSLLPVVSILFQEQYKLKTMPKKAHYAYAMRFENRGWDDTRDEFAPFIYVKVTVFDLNAARRAGLTKVKKKITKR